MGHLPAATKVSEPKIVTGDDGYALEDVPHLTDYIPDLLTYPNPLQDNPAYAVVKQYFVDVDDTVAQKAYILFGDEEYLYIFQEAYGATMHYLFHDSWYVEVNMNSATLVWLLFNSLQAFWPGLQVLAGDIDPAIRTHTAFFNVWKRYGFTPEGFNLASFSVHCTFV